jgi:hypothetical protein
MEADVPAEARDLLQAGGMRSGQPKWRPPLKVGDTRLNKTVELRARPNSSPAPLRAAS